MNPPTREARLSALAERSSYVENVLCHGLTAALSGAAWRRNPYQALQVFNTEVDDSGFDLILGVGSALRYVQLKQAHDEKVPTYVSVRQPFSQMPGSCVVLMSHSLETLALTSFRFYGGEMPSQPMPSIDSFSQSKAPGRRTAGGERKIRTNYRNVLLSKFQGPLTLEELLERLFPNENAI